MVEWAHCPFLGSLASLADPSILADRLELAPVAPPAEGVPFMDRVQSVDEDHHTSDRNTGRSESLTEAVDELGLIETAQAGLAHVTENIYGARHIHLTDTVM